MGEKKSRGIIGNNSGHEFFDSYEKYVNWGVNNFGDEERKSDDYFEIWCGAPIDRSHLIKMAASLDN